MKEPTVEAVFGVDAGIVWKALIKNSPSIIGDIVKSTGLRREFVYGGRGWLAREDKIVVERRGQAMVFSLRPLRNRSPYFPEGSVAFHFHIVE